MLNFIINAMEGQILSAQQFIIVIPVAAVVLLAVLVFVFGFQKTVEPPSFKQLNYSSDDKKAKKKKIKDKKQSNGHVVVDVPDTKKSESSKPARSPKVETPKPKKNLDVEKEKKTEPQKSPNKKDKKPTKDVEVSKKKKNDIQKPADFDEGEWETAPSRKDKKKKKDDQEIVASYTPEKPTKKSPAEKKEVAKKVEQILEFKPMEEVKIEDILPPKVAAAAPAVVPSAAPEAPPAVAAPVADVAVEVAASATVSDVAVEDASAKKKKTKKPKTSGSDNNTVVDAVEPQPAPVGTPTDSQPQVFNELEDSWKDAPQKKSKKKARKD